MISGGVDRQQIGYLRGDETTQIEKDDRVILFVPTEHITKVEKIFAVRVDFV